MPRRRPSGFEASTRLFSQALDPLAHRNIGLDGAMTLAMSSACFLLHTADLPETCALLTAVWQDLRHAP